MLVPRVLARVEVLVPMFEPLALEVLVEGATEDAFGVVAVAMVVDGGGGAATSSIVCASRRFLPLKVFVGGENGLA